jgi:hypothetical protein
VILKKLFLAAKKCKSITGPWFEEELIFTCGTENNFGVDIYFHGDVAPIRQ